MLNKLILNYTNFLKFLFAFFRIQNPIENNTLIFSLSAIDDTRNLNKKFLYEMSYFLYLKKVINTLSLIAILFIILNTTTTAECGTWDSTNTPRTDLEALVRTFDTEQLEELNHMLEEENTGNVGNSIVLSLLIFAAINITIIVIAKYGSTIFENIISLVTESADTLLETARQAAMHRINRLLENPENLPRVRNAIYTVVRMRQPNMPPIT